MQRLKLAGFIGKIKFFTVVQGNPFKLIASPKLFFSFLDELQLFILNFYCHVGQMFRLLKRYIIQKTAYADVNCFNLQLVG